MNIPSDCRYTKDHEWIRVEGSVGVVGITEFAQGELGELVFVELPVVGKQVQKGASLCVVESTKAASDVYAPVSGKIKEANSLLSKEPTNINSDPYGKGWMVKIEGVSAAEVQALMTSDQYTAHLSGKH